MSEGFDRPYHPVPATEKAFFLPVVPEDDGFWFGLCSLLETANVTHFETGLFATQSDLMNAPPLAEWRWNSPLWQVSRFAGCLQVSLLEECTEKEGMTWVHSSVLEKAENRLRLSPLVREVVDYVENMGLSPGVKAASFELGCPEFLEWAPGLSVFPMCTPTLPPATHTNTSILGSRTLIIVDPGSPSRLELERFCSEIDRRCEEGASVGRIVLTHHHADHVGGVSFLQERYDVPVAAHPLTRVRLGGRVRVDEDVEDGDRLGLGDESEVTALWTPGHASGHLVLWNEAAGWLIAGDMVAGQGTIVIDPPEGDMAEYLAQLDRLQKLASFLVVPAHGSPITRPGELFSDYIAHRLMRERSILQILKEEGPVSAGVIVSRIYTDLDPRAIPLAIRQVLAHLIKLECEGTVRQRTRDRWVLKELD